MYPAENNGSGGGPHDDKRGCPRRRVLKAAKVVYNGGHSVLDASLQDISDTGARIRLNAPAVLPEEFDLHLSDGRKLRVETVWTSGAMLGVRFVGPMAVPAQQPAARPAAAALLDRLAEIEARLAEFRKELIAHLRE